MSVKNKKFATLINCMDGRVQLPVNRWIKKNFGVDFVDTITEPGPNGILANNKDKTLIESIKRRLEISIKYHNSKLIAIVGHYDCAGNPVSKEEHKQHILLSIKKVKSWYPKIKIIGLWVNEKWQVKNVQS